MSWQSLKSVARRSALMSISLGTTLAISSQYLSGDFCRTASMAAAPCSFQSAARACTKSFESSWRGSRSFLLLFLLMRLRSHGLTPCLGRPGDRPLPKAHEYLTRVMGYMYHNPVHEARTY